VVDNKPARLTVGNWLVLQVQRRKSTILPSSWQAFDNGIPTGLESHEFLISPNDNKMYSVIEDGGANQGWVYRTVNAVQ
jgi:hypothetical protein